MARVRALDVNGDYSFGHGSANFLINSAAMVAQNVRTRLLLMEGEWFVDITDGTPYSSQILGERTKPLYDFAIQQRILGTIGVNMLTGYESALDPATRKLSISATINTVYGPTSVTVVF